MKRSLVITLMVLIMCVGTWCTTVTSTTKIIGIDGQPFNGTLTLQLPFAGVNSQTNQLILSTPYTVAIYNGSFTSFTVPGNDIMSPAMPYSVLYSDSFNNPITRQLYYISGTTFDVGSAPATPNFLNTNSIFAINITATGNVTEILGQNQYSAYIFNATCHVKQPTSGSKYPTIASALADTTNCVLP